MQLREMLTGYCCALTVSLIVTLTGIISFFTNPIILNGIIDGELILSPDKHIYTVWKKTPIPVFMEFHLFNWTNPQELRNPNVKPHLQEMGPYKFREVKEKVNITWHQNGTVSFRELKRWYFDAEKSNGSLSDEVTTLNVVAVSAAAQSKHLSYMMKKGFSLSVSTLLNDVYITKTVGELLFDGYQDTLIDVARNMPAVHGVDLPPFDKFGWFYLRNGSSDFNGLITMGTGKQDSLLGNIYKWNYRTRTDFYEGDCGRVEGSAGEFWPSNVAKDELFMFSPDMCRSIGFQFEREETVQGLKGYRFVGGEKTMDNGTLYPENKCFCNGECVPSGLLNVSSCRYGSPGFISFPHFYLADPFYLQQFDGLSPDPKKHELSITLEPRTGIPLAVSAKFQVNMLMIPYSDIRLFNDVPRLFFPTIWFQQQVVIPDDLADGLKQLISLSTVGSVISFIITAVGVTLLTMLFLIQLCQKKRLYHSKKNLKIEQHLNELMPLKENAIKEQVT